MFKELITHIGNHLDAEISLESLSRISGYSPYFLHRKFREESGETFGNYIKRQRIEKAAYLLVFTSLPITEIKYLVGYSTDSSFSKAFKQLMAVSPGAFRHSNRYKNAMDCLHGQEYLSLNYEKVLLRDREAVIFPSMGDYFSKEIYSVWKDVHEYLDTNGFQEMDFDYYAVLHVCQNALAGFKNRYDAVIIPNKEMDLNISKHFRTRLHGGKYVRYRLGCRVDQLQKNTLIIGKHLEDEGIRHGFGPSYFHFDRLPDPENPDNLFMNWYIPLER